MSLSFSADAHFDIKGTCGEETIERLLNVQNELARLLATRQISEEVYQPLNWYLKLSYGAVPANKDPQYHTVEYRCGRLNFSLDHVEQAILSFNDEI